MKMKNFVLSVAVILKMRICEKAGLKLCVCAHCATRLENHCDGERAREKERKRVRERMRKRVRESIA